MTIIRHGTKEPTHFRGTCDKCGCMVEVTRDETRFAHLPGSPTIPCRFLTCPDCKEDLWVE